MTPSREEMCVIFKDLDKRFGTTMPSPLHHDMRCPIHNSDQKRRYDVSERKLAQEEARLF